MSCKGCLYCCICCFMITDLTNHNNIWVLSKERLETCLIGIIILRIYLRLYNSLKLIFDRIFECNNFLIRSIEGWEERLECSCLSWSRRPCHDDHPSRFFKCLLDLPLCRPNHSKIYNAWNIFDTIEDTTYGIFSPFYWQCRDTYIEMTICIIDTIFSILRYIRNIELEVWSILHTLDHQFVLSKWKMKYCHEFTIDTKSEWNTRLITFKMHIRRSKTESSSSNQFECLVWILFLETLVNNSCKLIKTCRLKIIYRLFNSMFELLNLCRREQSGNSWSNRSNFGWSSRYLRRISHTKILSYFCTKNKKMPKVAQIFAWQDISINS